MRSHRFPLALAITAAFGAAACSDDVADPEPEAPVDALEWVSALTGVASPSAPGTHSCPAGGTVSVEASATTSTADGVVDITWIMTSAFDQCAIGLPDGTHLTTDGSLRTEGHQRARIESDRVTILEQTQHQTGRLHWTTPTDDRTCDYDLQHVLDADTRIVHVTGQLCGASVRFEFQLPGHLVS